jgi:hypothetical protein
VAHDRGMSAQDPVCSINLCGNPGVHEESVASSHWLFTVHYCREHHREISNGTPLGPLGIDASRVTVQALGTTELKVPAKQPSPSA